MTDLSTDLRDMHDLFPSHAPAAGEVVGFRVFVNGPNGGNPVPLVADARGMDDEAMRQVAERHGHESAFVLPAQDPRADWRLRFFVPRHEMEMCGHATVGSLWALRRWGLWTRPTAVIETLSGLVDVRWDEAGQRVWISQPAVRQQALDIAIGTPDAPRTCTVRQGDAMGRPSAIEVQPRFDAAGHADGCWLSGRVEGGGL